MTADEQAIREILQRFAASWNAGDSVGIGALFVEDANFIHIFGGQLDGRRSIEAAHRVILDTIYKRSHATFVLRSIRFVRPDVAVALSQMQVKFDGNQDTREMETRATLVVVKEETGWRVVTFQNTKITDVPAAAQAAANLAT